MTDRTDTPAPAPAPIAQGPIAEDLIEGIESRSSILPVLDTEFLLRPEMRPLRFALEYSKADILLRDWGIRSTIIVFGSARCLSPELAQTPPAGMSPERVTRQLGWYAAARAFGAIASKRGGAFSPRDRWRDNVIATGGGPGLMEAANRGAHDVGAPTIGFNITLPHEQHPNRYITPELNFQFHYFGMRKMHLAMRANALVVFPGGFGTLDELFEIITLQQTGKAPAAPVVLFDREYWQDIINFERLATEGMISPQDLDLFSFADTAEDIWTALVSRGLKAHTHNGGTTEGP
jgi:uncharacterized protein (TIGR00730 family)